MAENLWAVDRDPDSHNEGRLRAKNHGSGPVYINNKLVVTHREEADADSIHPEPATWTKDKSYSNTVFAYSRHAHRKDDLRDCDAKTVVEGQDDVFVGD